jgi:hypothetical protein
MRTAASLIFAIALALAATTSLSAETKAPSATTAAGQPAPSVPEVAAPSPADTTPTTPAKAEPKEPTTDTAKWYGNIKLWEVIVAAVVLLLGLYKAKTVVAGSKQEKVLAVIETSVSQVYDEFVRSAKSQAKDGKLTDDQIKQARDAAWEKAKALGKEKGLDLAKTVAADYVPVLIGKAVERLKTGTK